MESNFQLLAYKQPKTPTHAMWNTAMYWQESTCQYWIRIAGLNVDSALRELFGVEPRNETK